MKLVKWFLIVVGCLFIAIQFKRPARTNPTVDESQTIFVRTQMPPQVHQILNRCCADCHSNKTVWPWYTNVAPVSWFITNHVDQGRQDMNFSEWGKYDQHRQEKRLQAMCDLAKDGSMPLSSYTPLHAGSKPSAEDVKALCTWTEAERARLR